MLLHFIEVDGSARNSAKEVFLDAKYLNDNEEIHHSSFSLHRSRKTWVVTREYSVNNEALVPRGGDCENRGIGTRAFFVRDSG
jgi:hypothetical protein